MGQYDEIIENLIQIAKVGATSDGEKVRIQTMRLIRALRQSGDPLADRLQESVFSSQQSDSSNQPIRRVRGSGLSQPVPVDKESGADLLRAEDPVELSHKFISTPSLQSQIDGLVAERKNFKKLVSLNLAPSRTILFTGAPGVGKTMAAKKVAIDLKLPLLTLDLATVISSFLGRTGTNLKNALDYARGRPCVLLLDEIDAIAKRRDDSSDIGELKRIVTVILQELDLWPDHNLLIAATNHVDLLDTAVQRRFDQVIDFPAPRVEELIRLGRVAAVGDKIFSRKYASVLAVLMDESSYSDYIRELNKLRRALAIFGEEAAETTMASIISQRLLDSSLVKKKELAISLVEDAKISMRAACRLTGIARGTLSSALVRGDT